MPKKNLAVEPTLITLTTLRRMKEAGEKIVCLTAYDASFMTHLDAAGVDVALIGDSLGMVIQGQETTVPVTMDAIVYHTQAVARGRKRALLMADMPFMSYANVDQALQNAARLMQEGGAHMVKLEGGAIQVETVSQLTSRGIPVCAHIGLTPQSVHKLGGYRVQGRENRVAQAMKDDALALQAAGADMLILECVPTHLATKISKALDIPVIGIGAGSNCDGQILVLYDVIGVTPDRAPKFSHNFMIQGGSVSAAIAAYADAVRSGQFPTADHSFE